MNINQELVKRGWCWLYRRYAPGDIVLEGLKKEAREARKRKGLWANLQTVSHWDIAAGMSLHPFRRYVDFV
jgi:endonuclease YncB( thermonuclease family)